MTVEVFINGELVGTAENVPFTFAGPFEPAPLPRKPKPSWIERRCARP